MPDVGGGCKDCITTVYVCTTGLDADWSETLCDISDTITLESIDTCECVDTESAEISADITLAAAELPTYIFANATPITSTPGSPGFCIGSNNVYSTDPFDRTLKIRIRIFYDE